MAFVKAVRGVMPGLWDTEREFFYALSWSREYIGCPDCWAGLASHSPQAWQEFHAEDIRTERLS